MNKKIIGIVVIAIILGAAGITYTFLGNKENNEKSNNSLPDKVENDYNQNNNDVNDNDDNQIAGDEQNSEGKILVVYYSAQNHTKEVAKEIASNLSADIFEIVPKQVYTSDDLDWTNSNSRVSREHDNESLRDIELVSTSVDNWDSYDTVLIGYPIWWGIAAWPIDNFVKNNDFNGKTVIPFCTSASSGLGESGKLLEEKANGGNWLEGHRFNSNASSADIKTFTDNIE